MAYYHSNTLRSTPMFRPAAGFFGSSKADYLTGDMRKAQDTVNGWARMCAEVRIKLGQPNRKRPDVRRVHQAGAVRHLNAVRAAMRANLRALAVANAGLLVLTMTPDTRPGTCHHPRRDGPPAANGAGRAATPTRTWS